MLVKEKILRTKRLILKMPMQKDFSSLHKVWISTALKGSFSLEQTKNTFAHIINLYKNGQGVFWLIRLKSEDKVIGTCEFNNMDSEKRTADIGCELKKSYREHGYMTEALETVIKIAFRKYNFDMLYANVLITNNASQALFKKLGFFECESNVENTVRFCLANKREIYAESL